MVAAHVFVADLDTPELDPGDRHHLTRVLRLRPGEAVSVSDGAGRSRPCVVVGGSVLSLEAAGPTIVAGRPEPAVSVGFALTKGDRPEWVVQKLTEAGVDRIQPVVAERSVVRWEGERAAKQLSRLRQVARSAAMQSRRVWLPQVDEPVGLAEAMERIGRDRIALAHPGGRPPQLGRPGVFVGPEGGWTAGELDSTDTLVGLGPTVLRAETAAMAAGLLLCALRAGLVSPAAGI